MSQGLADASATLRRCQMFLTRAITTLSARAQQKKMVPLDKRGGGLIDDSSNGRSTSENSRAEALAISSEETLP